METLLQVQDACRRQQPRTFEVSKLKYVRLCIVEKSFCQIRPRKVERRGTTRFRVLDFWVGSTRMKNL
jgi:hypothetical protein